MLHELHCSRHPCQWDEEVAFAIKMCMKQDNRSKLYGSFFCEVVHGIWMHRNNMIFNGVKLSGTALFRDISFRVVVTCSDSMQNMICIMQNKLAGQSGPNNIEIEDEVLEKIRLHPRDT